LHLHVNNLQPNFHIHTWESAQVAPKKLNPLTSLVLAFHKAFTLIGFFASLLWFPYVFLSF